ncbi:MAG: beta-ketoacyl-[acyl-carrier-protein] synthase family protein [Desulfobulbaceae bacterium]|nr:beta-ketoacyl-[acyl-carrier-protein] synthase family protein [Desulfobulbaceae bacterium]HIJ78981.1 beta-ketoacyl-[acyl-carrier-protein] synthase family protein [Deltaproteobacteria bacterium]
MNSIVVVGVAIRTALGDLTATWNGLMANRCGLTSHQFPGFECRPMGLIADLSGDIGTSERLQALCAGLWAETPELPANTTLFCATTKGAVDELLLAPKGPWSGQPWQIGDYLAKLFGCRGHHLVSGACASGTLAIIQGAMALSRGDCEAAVVVGVDLISRFVLGGFAGLQALSPTGCSPFDRNRDGLSLGEGAGLMMLTTRKTAACHNWPVLAELAGYGVTCDATHITAPCRNASGLLAALRQATADGKLAVGGINAHGTGTPYNDAMELLAFSTSWETPPPVHSVKGAIGHCLGAAGVIEAVLAIMSLQHRVLPPTVGLRLPEDGAVRLSGKKTLALQGNSVLSCNSGFGGINAAVLFKP